MKKFLFYLLGILCAVLLSPVLAYALTWNVSSFEGGRGFAIIFLIPIIFVCLVVLFFIEQAVLKKKVANYHKKRTIFSGIVIVLAVMGFGISAIQDQRERVQLKRNSYHCRQELAKEFDGFVIEINDAHKMVKIRKSDSARSMRTYHFEKAQEAFRYSYTGQLVRKEANSELLLFTDKNGKVWEVAIPCYQ